MKNLRNKKPVLVEIEVTMLEKLKAKLKKEGRSLTWFFNKAVENEVG